MNVVILAAGLGKRMFSSLPKVLQLVGGRSMIEHVVETAQQLPGARKIIVVVGHKAELVQKQLVDKQVHFVLQKEQKGTGHALLQAIGELNENEPTLVLYGDVPLIKKETLQALIQQTQNGFGLLTVKLSNPTGYGRILREQGKVKKIVEEKDASEQQRAINEVNTGIMLIPAKDISRWLKQLKNDNQAKEYYLTDLIEFAVDEGQQINTFTAGDPWEVEGANSLLQLEALERNYQKRQAMELMKNGVRLADASRIDVRGKLVCGKDVFIDIGCVFEGNVTLEDGVQVGPYCVFKEAVVGKNTQVQAFSHFEDVVIGKDAKIGPYARLRPKTVISDQVHIGNFVEVKKSDIGIGSKVNHLTYIGDTSIGQKVNVGAGTITCNYDGANKFRTTIEDNCFIGSDTQLVAPVKVGKGATIGAGTTVTKDVPEDTLVISRVPQKEIKGWIRPKKKE